MVAAPPPASRLALAAALAALAALAAARYRRLPAVERFSDPRPGGAPSAPSEPSEPELEFASGSRTALQLAEETPGFLERLDGPNLAARGVASVGEYLRRYRDAVLPSVPPFERSRARRAYRAAAARAAVAAPGLMRGLPPTVRIAVSVGTAAENGYAHTAGDTIVLPISSVRGLSAPELAALVAHELVHIYQRRNPEAARRAALDYGFVEVQPEPGVSLRANPDTNGAVYRHGAESARPVLDDEPTSLASVRLLPNAAYTAFPGIKNPEHPYEIMAEHMETALFPAGASGKKGAQKAMA
jgi:hypothetical protein